MYIASRRDVAWQHALDTEHRLAKFRLQPGERELHASRRQTQRASPGEGVGVAWLQDRRDLLVRAVELHRLLVGLRVEPVEEDAAASRERSSCRS